MSVRVLLVDDQALVRAGFRRIIDAEPDLEVVGEAGDGLEAVHRAGRLDPDVILMDIRMRELDGLEATRRILGDGGRHAARPRIIMLTTFDLDEYIYAALRAGASGFMLKDELPEQLLDAVRIVAAGEALLAPSVTRRLIEQYARMPPPEPEPPAGLDELTPREREVLDHLVRGLSNGEIARLLVVSEGTVKTHVARLLAKLGLRDRVQAVVLAYESGLIRPGDNRPPAGGRRP
ncbi:MAG TPA: response regulator transcription factor [Solirubrobacteraceae bacterium]|nr:response regulator transcription factor [Solirubrobacteraceae bacterium]